jgi:hypothetical protein
MSEKRKVSHESVDSPGLNSGCLSFLACLVYTFTTVKTYRTEQRAELVCKNVANEKDSEDGRWAVSRDCVNGLLGKQRFDVEEISRAIDRLAASYMIMR